MLPLASSIKSLFLYRQDMRARSISKAGQNAMRILDNIIVLVVYVVVAAVVPRELYRFVQDAFSP
jgi:hypothetical protein